MTNINWLPADNRINSDRVPKILGMGGTLRRQSASLFVLKRALRAARDAGADTEVVDLADLDLPMYQPGAPLSAYDPQVENFIERLGSADGMIWSTAAYHGTLAGVTKNALDFFEFLRNGKPPYLKGKAVGLIATAGGDQAGVNAINAMVHIVHSLRGTAAPLSVPIPHTSRFILPNAGTIDAKWDDRLEKLGTLMVEMVSPRPAAVLAALSPNVSSNDLHIR